jgi:hypothetical protein
MLGFWDTLLPGYRKLGGLPAAFAPSVASPEEPLLLLLPLLSPILPSLSIHTSVRAGLLPLLLLLEGDTSFQSRMTARSTP